MGGWVVVEVFAEIKAISAHLSWRLAGWLGLSLAKVTELLVESDPNLTLRYNPMGNLPWC